MHVTFQHYIVIYLVSFSTHECLSKSYPLVLVSLMHVYLLALCSYFPWFLLTYMHVYLRLFLSPSCIIIARFLLLEHILIGLRPTLSHTMSGMTLEKAAPRACWGCLTLSPHVTGVLTHL